MHPLMEKNGKTDDFLQNASEAHTQLNLKLAQLPLTDLGNAERFYERYKDQFFFSSEKNLWFCFDKQRWSAKGAELMLELAICGTVRLLTEEVAALQNAGESTLQSLEKLKKWAFVSQNFTRMQAAIKIARAYFAHVPASFNPGPSDFDALHGFLSACTEPFQGAKIQSSVLHKKFSEWCRTNGHSEWTLTAFGRAMRKRGFVSKRSPSIFWLDLRLINSSELQRGNAPQAPVFRILRHQG